MFPKKYKVLDMNSGIVQEQVSVALDFFSHHTFHSPSTTFSSLVGGSKKLLEDLIPFKI